MARSSFLFAIVILLCACGGESAATSKGLSGEAQKAASHPDRAHNWAIEIEGLPGQSGRNITAVTMGGNGRFAFARPGFTASIGLMEQDPHSDVMIHYSGEKIRCLNKGDASVVAMGERAVISGEVMCMPANGDGERHTAAIAGWFELEQ